MIVTCESCAARYKLDDSKVTGRGARITCPRCRHVFVVYPDGGGSPDPAEQKTVAARPRSGSGASPAPGGGRSAASLDFRKVGIASWKVRVKIGLVYDFSDIKTLRKYIQDGRVTSEDRISHDGQTWVTIGDIPDLDAYFIQVYEQAEAEMGEGEGESGFEEEDAPTMIVGMGSLGNDLAAEALRQATGEAVRSPSPSTPSSGGASSSGSGEFVDPFAALKSKQRERMQARRSHTAPPPEPDEGGRSRVGLALVAVLVLALAGGGWWYTQMGPGAAVAPPPVDPTPPEATGPDPNPTPEEGAGEGSGAEGDDGLRIRVEDLMEEVDQDRNPIVEEPPERIPVRPTDATLNRPQGGTPDQGSAATAASVDHKSNCLSFLSQGDAEQAVYACAKAAEASPGDTSVMAAHGIALYRTGQRSTATQKLKAAERAGSQDPRVLKYLGHIARDNGDIAGARGYYQRYLDSNPPDRAAIEQELRSLDGT